MSGETSCPRLCRAGPQRYELTTWSISVRRTLSHLHGPICCRDTFRHLCVRRDDSLTLSTRRHCGISARLLNARKRHKRTRSMEAGNRLMGTSAYGSCIRSSCRVPQGSGRLTVNEMIGVAGAAIEISQFDSAADQSRRGTDH